MTYMPEQLSAWHANNQTDRAYDKTDTYTIKTRAIWIKNLQNKIMKEVEMFMPLRGGLLFFLEGELNVNIGK